MIRLLLLAAILCGSATAQDVLRVPSDEYPTIQSAVDAASDGDTVLVAAGRYVENISITNKSITLKSIHGPRMTILDGASKKSVIFYRAGEPGKYFTLEGFTVINGAGTTLGGIPRRGPMQGKKKGRKQPPPMSGQGGGIYALHGYVEIRRNIIMGNNCFDGGGVYISAECVLRDNVIAFNLATRQGGGVYLDKCEARCFNNYIISNTGANSGGGFFLNTEDRAVRITDSIFFDNWSFYGGGINADQSSPVIADNLFHENKGCRGGAVLSRNEGANPVIENNVMDHNWACYGGGVCVRNKASARIMGNIVSCNTTHNPYCIQAPQRKGEDYSGGGLSFWESKDSVAAGNMIFNNIAELHGGGIACDCASPLLVNNTVYGNIGETDVGGLYCIEGACPKVFHSIFWGNVPNEVSGAPEVTGCDVQGGCPGEGNVDLDPRFHDAENLDFHLHVDSPLRDAGTPCREIHEKTDFEGDPRVAGSALDIGADEFFPVESTMGMITIEALQVPRDSRPSIEKMISAMEADLPHWYDTRKRDVFARVPVDGLLEYMRREDLFPMPPVGGITRSYTMLQVEAGKDLSIPSHPSMLDWRITWTSLGRDASGAWKPSGRIKVLSP